LCRNYFIKCKNKYYIPINTYLSVGNIHLLDKKCPRIYGTPIKTTPEPLN
jgi:hypothetical protein